MKNPISYYIVCDSDGNALVGEEARNVRHPHPDDAWRTARHVVAHVWKDYDVGTIYGVVDLAGVEHVRENIEIKIPLIRFHRGGPPGSKAVVFTAVDFEHLSLKETPL